MAQNDPSVAVLRTMLRERGEPPVWACIDDLLENGLVADRFPSGPPSGMRQPITQYLAAWSRQVGLSKEECERWLIDYSVAVLGRLSKRTPAAIRHSTKSNIKYIYKDAVAFQCELEENPFRARCSLECPVRAEMQVSLEAQRKALREPRPAPPPFVPVIVPKVKDVFREQFQAGLRLALEESGKGTRLRRINEMMAEGGFKTRMGKAWTETALSRELKRARAAASPLGLNPEP